jgi:DNA-binding CsgD family transcriptional regulator
MVGIVQLGLAIGVLASFLCKDLLIWLNLPVEIQIVALFLNSTLLCVALFTTIFGMRQTAVKTTQGVWMQTNVSPKQSAAQSFAGYLSEKGLTSRQAEVTVLAAKGYTVPAIAEGLVIAKKTVENHLTQAYKILDIHSKQELIKQYQSFDKGLR